MGDVFRSGLVTRLNLEACDDESFRLEITVGAGPLLRFDGVSDLRMGQGHEALALNTPIHLQIRSIADFGLETAAYRIASIEQDWTLSFDCARWSEI